MERIEEQQHYLFHSIMKLLPKSRSPCIVDICDKTPFYIQQLLSFGTTYYQQVYAFTLGQFM